MTSEADIVSEYWGEERYEGRLHSWLQHPVAWAYIAGRVSGDPAVDTLTWFKQQYFPKPAKLCLSLGCGFGVFERTALQVGVSDCFDAFDISAGAVEKARLAAAESGLADRISYEVRDLEAIDLPESMYDAIFITSAAHHVFHLEHLFAQCRTALKPGALLFLDEYIGPSRFQSAPFVSEAINRIRALLPDRYRRDLFANDGSLVGSYEPPSPEQLASVDPSEAVRSAEIVNTLRQFFEIVQFRPYGGGIQHMLFSGIMGNFDAAEPSDVTLLKVIACFEELLENCGAIQSDFAAIVARPRVERRTGLPDAIQSRLNTGAATAARLASPAGRINRLASRVRETLGR